MKINIRIVLFPSGGIRRPRFQKTIDYIVSIENFGECISGGLTVQVGGNFYKITFPGNKWDKITATLNAVSEMRECECNGYLKTLIEDGWEEISS